LASPPALPSSVVLSQVGDSAVAVSFAPSPSAVDGHLVEFDSIASFDSSFYRRYFEPSVSFVSTGNWKADRVYARVSAHSPDGGFSATVLSNPRSLELAQPESDDEFTVWTSPPRIFYLLGGLIVLLGSFFALYRFIKRRRALPTRGQYAPPGSSATSGPEDAHDIVLDEAELEHDAATGFSAEDAASSPAGSLTGGSGDGSAGCARDANWFQSEWERIHKSHTLELPVIQHQYLDAAVLERLIERSRFCLIASGLPSAGTFKSYFYGSQGAAIVLVELLLDSEAYSLKATFKTAGSSAALKDFERSFKSAFSSILQQEEAKKF